MDVKGGKIVPRIGIHPACSEGSFFKPEFRRSFHLAKTQNSLFKDHKTSKLMSKSKLEPSLVLKPSRENSAVAEPEIRYN